MVREDCSYWVCLQTPRIHCLTAAVNLQLQHDTGEQVDHSPWQEWFYHKWIWPSRPLHMDGCCMANWPKPKFGGDGKQESRESPWACLGRTQQCSWNISDHSFPLLWWELGWWMAVHAGPRFWSDCSGTSGRALAAVPCNKWSWQPITQWFCFKALADIEAIYLCYILFL